MADKIPRKLHGPPIKVNKFMGTRASRWYTFQSLFNWRDYERPNSMHHVKPKNIESHSTSTLTSDDDNIGNSVSLSGAEEFRGLRAAAGKMSWPSHGIGRHLFVRPYWRYERRHTTTRATRKMPRSFHCDQQPYALAT